MRRLASFLVLVALFGVTACTDEPLPTEPTGQSAVELASAPTFSVGSWDYKLTGGGWAAAGSCNFSLTTSVTARDGTEDGVTGMIEYYRDETSCPSAAPLAVHSSVDCLWVSEDGLTAIAAGPVQTVQNDPGGYVTGPYWGILVVEGGDGAGDRVRTKVLSSAEYATWCAGSAGSPGATIYDGNYNIREK